MLDLIIKNGHIVNADEEFDADIAIKDGKIVELGNSVFFPEAKHTIDASNLLVIPGMIDSHAHIQSNTTPGMESLDDYYSGSIAAAYGGTTSIIDFALPAKDESPIQAMEKKLNAAKGNSVVNYSFHSGINRCDQQSLDDIIQLRREGFPSVKIFTVYRKNLMLDKAGTLEVMRSAARDGGLVMIHAECAELIEHNISSALLANKTSPLDHALCRPAVTELEAMNSILSLQQETDAAVLFAHMTTGQAYNLLKDCKDRAIFTEVCPHYLTLTEEVYSREDGYKYVCSPPIRSQKEQDGLWRLIEEHYVDLVNSDHTDYSIGQKIANKNYFPKIPNGLPTLETRGVALYSEGVAKGKITAKRFVDLVSAKAAKLMGLYPQKGLIQVGSDADIVLFNPNHSTIHTIGDLHMKTDYTPYEGMKFTGQVVSTIIGGNLVIEQGNYKDSGFRGSLLQRKTI